VAVLAVWGWAIQDVYFAYMGEQWTSAALGLEARIEHAADQASDDDYANLISAAEGAFGAEPDNAKYGYWLNYYRWAALRQVTDPETGEVLLHPDVLPFVARIADELSAVRQICPTYGPPYALEGQLRMSVLQQAAGAELIRKGVRLAAYDPPTCLVAGELAAREGKLEEAESLLTRAVALRPDYFRDVIDIYLQKVNQPQLARRLAGEDYWRLEELAQSYGKNPEYAALVDKTRAEALASLRHRTSGDDAEPQDLAALARIELAEGDKKSAAELYRRALSQDYRQIEWRVDLARALLAEGQLDEAIHEVRICLRLRPQYGPGMQLLEELIKRKEAIRD
jgi:Flp pilus assembly protein TadD